jgi:hypothetical protein
MRDSQQIVALICIVYKPIFSVLIMGTAAYAAENPVETKPFEVS